MCNQTPTTLHKHNLSAPERACLKALAQNKDIIIKTADKGGGIVIQNRNAYAKEAHRLLSDSNTYPRLPRDPLFQFTSEVHMLVEKITKDETIEKAEAAFLKRENYNTPYFYHFPKIHKSLTNPPGRPIVVVMDSVTNPFSLTIFCTHCLRTYQHISVMVSIYWTP